MEQFDDSFLPWTKQVARCLTCTRETFVMWEEAFRLRWMRSCREVGEILRLLVTALDYDGLEGRNLTRLACFDFELQIRLWNHVAGRMGPYSRYYYFALLP